MIDGFVLAGGLSSRLGMAKADVVLGGQTLLQRAVAAATVVSDSPVRVISGASAPSSHDGIEYIKDILPPRWRDEVRAPIIGLYTALESSQAEWIFLLAVDLPFVSPELIAFLVSRSSSDFDAVVPVQPEGRRQPLCAFYRRLTCRDAIGRVLNGEDLSFHALFRMVRVCEIAASEYEQLPGHEHFFHNINTPDDLDRARRVEQGR